MIKCSFVTDAMVFPFVASVGGLFTKGIGLFAAFTNPAYQSTMASSIKAPNWNRCSSPLVHLLIRWLTVSQRDDRPEQSVGSPRGREGGT